MKRESVSSLERARAMLAAGDANSAIALLRVQLAAGRGGLLTRIALGGALMDAGDANEGLSVLREAALLFPSVAEAALALGHGLMASGYLPTAIAEFQRALTLDPDSEAAGYALGSAWLEAGEADKAAATLRPIAQAATGQYRNSAVEKLQQVESTKRLNRSPAGYVRHLFDQFSANYDHNMVQDLQYRAPAILRALADLLMGGIEGPLDILDLGCGTGLAAEAFKTLARRLDGIDLSPLMIERAKARGIYDDLVTADLEVFLRQSDRQYDLLLAADTLVYLGDLSNVFCAVRERLRSNGYFLFTVERQRDAGYALGPRRRYRHSDEYVRAVAQRSGLECMGILDCSPRIEAGQPVEGLAICLRYG
jgi:predicted TPR repeat methyltransferase